MNQIDHGQQNTDYSGYIGRNILPMPGDKSDPFGGEVPDDRQGYAAYRQHYEGLMEDTMGGMSFMQMSVSCEDREENGTPIYMRGRKHPAHEGCGIVWACNHVIHQDPVNPEGVNFIPFKRNGAAGFYLCRTCAALWEGRARGKRKMSADEIKVKCAKCVLESVLKIAETHPDRLKNFAGI